MYRGETSIYRTLFMQKARKWLPLHLQTAYHTNIPLIFNSLNITIPTRMAIFREMPKICVD
jgi:hypothetical protein